MAKKLKIALLVLGVLAILNPDGYCSFLGEGFRKKIQASDVSLDTSSFVGNLSSSDSDVQKLAEAVDGLTAGSGLADVVDDTTPQLGGDLDLNGHVVTGLVIGTNVQAYDADLTTWAAITPGTGVGTALATNVGSSGAVVVNGGALGTPSSGTLTNATGLPAASVVAGTFGSGSFVVPGNLNYTNNAIAASSNTATVPITFKFNTVTNDSAATLTITMTTTSAVNGQLAIVRILDASAVAQTITWVNTEDSGVACPTTSNGSTTLPLTVGLQYNSATSKWRCLASA